MNAILKAKVGARFPANVKGVSPVIVQQSGLNYLFSLDINTLAQILPPPVSAQARPVFGNNAEYFVNPVTGSNSNIGTNASQPFATIQHAINTICARDLVGWGATVELADGTYNEAISLGAYFGRSTQGHVPSPPGAFPPPITIRSSSGNPSNCVISCPIGLAVPATITAVETGGYEYIFSKVRIQNLNTGASAGAGVLADAQSWVVLDQVDFGVCSGAIHGLASAGGILEFVSSGTLSGGFLPGYTISGAADYHLVAQGHGKILFSGAHSNTISVATQFTSAFVACTTGGLILRTGSKWVGTTPTNTIRWLRNSGGEFDDQLAALDIVYPGDRPGRAPASWFEREILAANRNYYVSPTGNESNDGMDPNNAFASLARAIQVIIGELDFHGWQVTINIAPGTYSGTGGIISTAWVGGGTLLIQGTGASPAQTLLDVTAGNGLLVQSCALPGTVTLQNMTIQTSGAGTECILNNGVGTVDLNNIVFGKCNTHYVAAIGGGAVIQAIGPLSVDMKNTSFSIVTFAYAQAGASVFLRGFPIKIYSSTTAGQTLTLTAAFAYSIAMSFIGFEVATFPPISGNPPYPVTIAGKRYHVEQNSVINTATSGLATALPGSVPGDGPELGTGGVYQ